MPIEVLQQFVLRPDCQLRGVCRRFWAEIRPKLYESAGEIMTATWYKSMTSASILCEIVDGNSGKRRTIHHLAAVNAPYILLRDDISSIEGMMIWSTDMARHFTNVAMFTLYRCKFYHYPGKIRAESPEHYGSGDKLELLVVSAYFNDQTVYNYVNYFDALTIGQLRFITAPSYIYERVNMV